MTETTPRPPAVSRPTFAKLWAFWAGSALRHGPGRTVAALAAAVYVAAGAWLVAATSRMAETNARTLQGLNATLSRLERRERRLRALLQHQLGLEKGAAAAVEENRTTLAALGIQLQTLEAEVYTVVAETDRLEGMAPPPPPSLAVTKPGAAVTIPVLATPSVPPPVHAATGASGAP
jgi:hypothetical protein